MDHGCFGHRRDLQCGVYFGGSGPSDDQRCSNTRFVKFFSYIGHLAERGGDQPREADNVGLMPDGLVDDAFGRNHHTEIDDIVVVAFEDYRDDVFPDVVDIALDGREQNSSGRRCGRSGFLRINARLQDVDGLFHDSCCLDNLRQKHLAFAEQCAYTADTVHQRTFDDVYRPLESAGGFGKILGQEFAVAFDNRVQKTLGHRDRRAIAGFFCRYTIG